MTKRVLLVLCCVVLCSVALREDRRGPPFRGRSGGPLLSRDMIHTAVEGPEAAACVSCQENGSGVIYVKLNLSLSPDGCCCLFCGGRHLSLSSGTGGCCCVRLNHGRVVAVVPRAKRARTAGVQVEDETVACSMVSVAIWAGERFGRRCGLSCGVVNCFFVARVSVSAGAGAGASCMCFLSTPSSTNVLGGARCL